MTSKGSPNLHGSLTEMHRSFEDYTEFNDYLDKVVAPGDEPELIRIGEEVIYRPSQILWDADRTAYWKELELWENKRGIELRKLADEALVWHSNEFRLERVQKSLLRGTLMPFVGAGLSVPSGYSGWSNFLLTLAQQVGKDIREIGARLSKGEFEQVSEDIRGCMPPAWFDEKIEESFDRNYPVRGPIRYIPAINPKGCVTTNLDRCLEKIFRLEGAEFEEVMVGSEARRFRAIVSSGATWLLKLHGDARNPETRVITSSEYDAAYLASESTLVSVIEWIFSHGCILFLGCSLRDDRVLRSMKELAGTGNGPRHFAIVEEPSGDDSARREREGFLSERGIFPIWYPEGEHDYVEAILFFLRESIRRGEWGGS